MHFNHYSFFYYYYSNKKHAKMKVGAPAHSMFTLLRTPAVTAITLTFSFKSFEEKDASKSLTFKLSL